MHYFIYRVTKLPLVFVAFARLFESQSPARLEVQARGLGRVVNQSYVVSLCASFVSSVTCCVTDLAAAILVDCVSGPGRFPPLPVGKDQM